MPQQCTVCASPQRSGIDARLDRGTSCREIASHSEFSRAAVTRHASHRAERALIAVTTAATLLATPDLTTPTGVADRFRELATTAAHLSQLAASSGNPVLVLRALREEAALLDRIAPRIPAEQAAQERQLQIFRTVATAARDTLDPEAAQRFAAQVNDDLRRQGLVRLETAS